MSKRIKFLVNNTAVDTAKGDTHGFEAKYSLPEDVDIDTNRIKELLENLVESTQDIKPEKSNGFIIDEIEISLGVNAKGKFGVLSFGIEGGGQAGIKIKIKRINN